MILMYITAIISYRVAVIEWVQISYIIFGVRWSQSGSLVIDKRLIGRVNFRQANKFLKLTYTVDISIHSLLSLPALYYSSP